ncbi:glycoside hydrolase [Paenibacillus sp. ACRRX]|uniref:glycoside hydrolase family 38 N-terminal domain-containing protein n=1 Tax=Paenibacillus sp. ACRRX TaxID=2918206 RepID=UPI001EF70225|nr:glycoside hydrolase family 38 C-terminal domain-containing protein [Paenibacillus sp. ACRRX]MCG7408081.1 glycoside hydrolase [Paenibacillus sp. ACRRX]
MDLIQQIKQTSIQQPSRPWTIYAIHHSHTDIGYTERQEKIEQYHVDFIRQALRVVTSAHDGSKPEWKGFRWTCETFWAVERFLEEASPAEQQSFADAVLRGDIELSGTYLNMTELPDYDLLQRIHSKAQAYAASIGHTIDSAMTADINGYSWGYAQSLLDNGIQHLFSCIHTHHGMYALGRKQQPFWWETAAGNKLLVWNGEHYMFGNELGLCPDALGKYMIQDEFQHQLYENKDTHDQLARIRLNRYVCQLEAEQYPFSFVPVMLSGLATDNGAPNSAIADWISEWNTQFGDSIRIEMTTLSAFFARLKQENLTQLPVHRGDWPDWWSDGVSSTAMHTQIYRDAQRTLRKVKRLDPDRAAVTDQEIGAAEQALIMYAEHTWGYHSSIYEPWHPNVQLLEVRKQTNAAEASRLAYRALDKALLAQGTSTLYPNRPYRYRVVNLADTTARDMITLSLDGWEPAHFPHGLEVVCEETGKVLPHQAPHQQSIIVDIELQAKGECTLALRARQDSSKPVGSMTSNTRLMGSDRVYDMEDMFPKVTAADAALPIHVTQHGVESPYIHIKWQEGTGIMSWYNKETEQEMLRSDRNYNAFTPIYEVTPPDNEVDPSQVWAVRSQMGRNRKGIKVKRSVGQLVRIRTLENGPLYATVELLYKVEGMSYYALFLKVHACSNRVDVSIRLHKDSVWNPENVYVALPFTSGNAAEDTVYADKAGVLVRPWIDQLPGTCLDYSCIQEGIAWQDASNTLLLGTPDTPLIQWGSLEYGRRLVHSQQPANAKPETYAWLMTNYWETNFKATLGGFYEFRYLVSSRIGLETSNIKPMLDSLTSGILVSRVH